jgi:hypothetical protein
MELNFFREQNLPSKFLADKLAKLICPLGKPVRAPLGFFPEKNS